MSTNTKTLAELLPNGATYQNGVRPGRRKLAQFQEALRIRQTPALYSQDGKGMPYHTLLRLVHQYASKQHLGVNVTPHTFRRSCTTELIRGGANLYHVKKLLGHESLETLRHYTRLTITDLKKTHEKCHPRSGAKGEQSLFATLAPFTTEIIMKGSLMFAYVRLFSRRAGNFAQVEGASNQRTARDRPRPGGVDGAAPSRGKCETVRLLILKTALIGPFCEVNICGARNIQREDAFSGPNACSY